MICPADPPRQSYRESRYMFSRAAIPNTGFAGAMASKRIVGGGYNRVKLVGHCFEEFVMSANSAPNPGLALTIDRTENETIVHCSGRIVSDTVSSLRDVVKPLLSKNHTVVLDLTDKNYMDSSGLGAIVGLYVSSKAAGSELRLINLNNRLKELFSITRLGEVIARGRDPNELVLP